MGKINYYLSLSAGFMCITLHGSLVQISSTIKGCAIPSYQILSFLPNQRKNHHKGNPSYSNAVGGNTLDYGDGFYEASVERCCSGKAMH